VHHDRTKHIDTKFHYTRTQVEGGALGVDHVSTEEQLADILTKALGRKKFVELRKKIGVRKIKQQVGGGEILFKPSACLNPPLVLAVATHGASTRFR
jgi:hypothetical protein